MTIIDVVGIATVFIVAVVVIVSNVVIARSECRINRELCEYIEKMKGEQMGEDDDQQR